jgi:hypothetical protein
MVAEAIRVCPICGTSLQVSIVSCPVCALRHALDFSEGESTTVALLSDWQRRFEHYEIVIREDQKPFELGRGAMGVTYKAIDTNLHCPVALKVINSRYLDDKSVCERFLTEARAAAGLRHPNVASVFHLGTVEGDYFYAVRMSIYDPICTLLGLLSGRCLRVKFHFKVAFRRSSGNISLNGLPLSNWNTCRAQSCPCLNVC